MQRSQADRPGVPVARRGLLLAGAAAAGAAAAADRAAIAQPGPAAGAYPNRPVRIIVPFPPGGSNDVIARPLAERLQVRLGQPVVIDNRGGAGGAIGATAVAQSPGDGYTLMVTSSTFVTTSVVQRTSYDLRRDFVPVALLARSPFFILAAPDFPATGVADLIRLARERPGEIDYGSSGPGSVGHFVTELFAQRAGIRLQHVPYRGMAPAVTDLLAGHIKILITTLASAAGPVRDGKLKLLAYTAPGAPAGSPPGPTVREATGLDYEAEIWWGLFAPRGLPPELLRTLNAAANAVLAEPDFARLIQGEGAVPSPTTPEAFAATIEAELERWREVARVANIRLD
ncbi:ABC transporter substrate-binding protein [Caldovatus sediminis]|uniref:ABC transporter substrate-binding protein n=1 Tax=Caldovatus sediminis TaxID=2041189 RepID=A0A8J3EBD8_9PROT|nr:tripartite tricarboxylate transporter substrate-binding protein [Caldovatus sediminis]GGG22233.1 ABC transporter substrate-binding protein [Caldovatus sediminis]